MRKKVFGRHLSRGRKSREALFRSLIGALIANGKIVTTKAKAKAVSGQIDKLVTLLKKNDVSGRRKAVSYLGNKREVVTDLVTKVLPAFGERKSGFTRIILLPRRLGDNAEMARIEWVDQVTERPSKSTTKKTEEKKGSEKK